MKSKIEANKAIARYNLARADAADLEYVEQETGTKHARDMDKQRAQSQGNQALEVTKALTKPRKEGESAPDLAAAVGYNAVSDRLAPAAV